MIPVIMTSGIKILMIITVTVMIRKVMMIVIIDHDR